jgi:hypothetical protein
LVETTQFPNPQLRETAKRCVQYEETMELNQIKLLFTKNQFYFKRLVEEFKKEKAGILYPNANEVIFDYSQSLEYIMNSMIENAQTQNLYASSILYRASIEHFFKGFYVFAKTLAEKNDSTAGKFKKHYFISEFLAEQAGFLDMEDLISGNTEKTNYLDFLVNKIPSLAGFDKTNQQEISAASKQFNLKGIIPYFYKFVSNNPNIPNSTIIAQMIPEYSKFSSFTHGGPYAITQMNNHREKQTILSEHNRILELCLTSYKVTCKIYFMTYKPGIHVKRALEGFDEIT